MHPPSRQGESFATLDSRRDESHRKTTNAKVDETLFLFFSLPTFDPVHIFRAQISISLRDNRFLYICERNKMYFFFLNLNLFASLMWNLYSGVDLSDSTFMVKLQPCATPVHKDEHWVVHHTSSHTYTSSCAALTERGEEPWRWPRVTDRFLIINICNVNFTEL